MGNDKKQLNNEQKQAVTHGDGPVLIVAGAGTGKTTVITERIGWLIEQKKAKADEILALTFTDKAAGEMEERVDKLLPYGYLDLWIMTFHSFCERVLKMHALDIGISNDFKLLNETEQWMLIRQNLDKFNLDYYRPLGNPTKFIHALIKHFSRCKDEDIGPGEYLEYAEGLKINQDNMESALGRSSKMQDTTRLPLRGTSGQVSKKVPNSKPRTLNSISVDENEIRRLGEIAGAYHVYQQLLLDNNSLDFGDLINYSLKLFRERPGILKYYQQKFKYILVDEFQDTNWAQYELVKLLVGKRVNLTVCGDDDQSIFAFRGASMSNILHFKEDYPESEQIFLIENYRSKQNILDLSYNFIQFNNPERLEIRLQKKHQGKLSKRLESKVEGKGIIEHLHLESEQDEIEAVVNKIIELHNNGKEATRPRVGEASWNDFAILIRANSMADGFMQGLEQAQVPYIFMASRGLYSKPMVMDIMAFLKLVDDYHESRALWRVLNWPVFKIDHKTIQQISYLARRKTWSIYEALKRSPGELKFSNEVYREISKVLSLIDKETSLAREKSVGRVVLDLLVSSGWEKYLTQTEEQKENRERLRHINQFYKKIQEFEKSFDDKSVKNFLEQMEMELEAGDSGVLQPDLEEGPEAVKIMTIHGAKGLEFKYVFIVNMVDKRFPTTERRDPIDIPDELIKEIIPTGDIHLQEERRLFYVGMTRAKQGLWLCSAEDYGGARKKKLSRFIYELGLDKVNMGKEVSGESSKKQDTISKKITSSKLQINSNSRISNVEVPSRFSFTQLKAYETCPYQYKFAHVFKIPVVGKAQFSFGKTMHSTLQKFFASVVEQGQVAQGSLFEQKKGYKDTRIQTNSKSQIPNIENHNSKLSGLEQLLNIYEQSWIEEWYDNKKQKEEYYKKGKEILKEFYDIVKEDVPKVKYLEKGFSFKLGEYSVRGTMDRVDELEDGSFEIVDYKTGAAKDKKSIEKDQLLIYQLASEQVFDKKIGKLTFYYLNNNKPVSFLGTEKELEKQKQKMMDIIEGIKSGKYEPNPGFACKYCDFKDICEYRVL